MVDNSKNPGLIVLSIVLLLVGLALIVVSVIFRDSIGNFASILLNGVAILIAVIVPMLWQRRRNQQTK